MARRGVDTFGWEESRPDRPAVALLPRHSILPKVRRRSPVLPPAFHLLRAIIIITTITITTIIVTIVVITITIVLCVFMSV